MLWLRAKDEDAGGRGVDMLIAPPLTAAVASSAVVDRVYDGWKLQRFRLDHEPTVPLMRMDKRLKEGISVLAFLARRARGSFGIPYQEFKVDGSIEEHSVVRLCRRQAVS